MRTDPSTRPATPPLTPLALGTLLLASGCGQPPTPLAPVRIRVLGETYQWRIRHPGPDGELDTDDDVLTERHLDLPANTEVVLELESRDLLYGFRIPALGINEMAIPEIPGIVRLVAPTPGRYPLRGDQMCGFTHPDLIGQVVVHPPGGYRLWAAATGRGTP